jgi:hypothetical protein
MAASCNYQKYTIYLFALQQRIHVSFVCVENTQLIIGKHDGSDVQNLLLYSVTALASA